MHTGIYYRRRWKSRDGLYSVLRFIMTLSGGFLHSLGRQGVEPGRVGQRSESMLLLSRRASLKVRWIPHALRPPNFQH